MRHMSAGQRWFQTLLVPDPSQVTAKPHSPAGSPSVNIKNEKTPPGRERRREEKISKRRSEAETF